MYGYCIQEWIMPVHLDGMILRFEEESSGLSSTTLLFLLFFPASEKHSSTSPRDFVATVSSTATQKQDGVYVLITVSPYLQSNSELGIKKPLDDDAHTLLWFPQFWSHTRFQIEGLHLKLK